MMKKFLILMMVLGIASQANAMLQISVNGDKEPLDSEYTVMAPSGYLVLDVWTMTAITPGVGEGYWALVANVAGASISGGIVIAAKPTAEPGVVIYDDAVTVGEILGLGNQNGVWGGIGLTGLGTYAAGDTIYDEIVFHCEAPGDVTINLYRLDSPTWSVIEPPEDSVIVHQIIPEPITRLYWVLADCSSVVANKR